ncbi:ABC transporter substrate-binding protein [Streptomyces sp. AM2-3-1]|uniref:ABC transporter substrate-binding protein n=1 Tax=Streptomyces sp. AM2-3-1 TaxID=3075824 RepID=UPI0028C4EE2B|nr:ABC transporter substrate-binding protein [Streptomyces sp. AM2-3-1]WNO67446.1 ABC transporter substrate-binding protein [Streptomyces sp. AM2-3-1]
MPSSLAFALDSMPLAKDFHWPIDYDSRLVGEALVRTLFSESHASTKPAGNAAVTARPRDEGRTWHVSLDGDMRWSDGVPLRSAHARAAVDRILARPRSMAARLLSADGTGPVRVVDDVTVEYRFRKPTAFAPEILTLPQFAPFRDAVNGKAVSLGGFEETASAEGEIRLSRHSFGDRSGSGPEQLVFTKFSSHRDALDAYTAGSVDVTPATGFTQDQLDEFSGCSRLVNRDVSMFGSLEFGGLATRFRESPDCRRALGGLLDRPGLVERVPGLLNPWWQRTDLWQTSRTAGENRPAESLTGLEISQLREALHGERVIAYADFPPNGEVVAGICEQVRSATGVVITARPMTFPEYVRTAVSRKYDMLYTLTTADYPHAAALLTPWHSKSAAGAQAGLGDPVLDRLMDTASASLSAQEANLGWVRANDRWLELMPRIPLVQVRANCLHSEAVLGLNLSTSGFFDFDQISVN